jgi:hypothetical protein
MKTKLLHACLRITLLLVVIFVLFSIWYLVLDVFEIRRHAFSLELRMFWKGLLYSTIFSGFFISFLFHIFNFTRKKLLWALSLSAFMFLHTFILAFILNGGLIQFQPLDFRLPTNSIIKTCILIFASSWISDSLFFSILRKSNKGIE